MQGGGVGPGGVHGLQDGGGRGQALAAAAVLLGDQHAEEAALGHGLDEGGGVGALAIQLAPVGAGEAGAQGGDRLADRAEGGVVEGIDEGGG